MNDSTKLLLAEVTLGVSFLTLAFTLGMQVGKYGFPSSFAQAMGERPDVINVSFCGNLSLVQTAKCLQDFVAPYYNYTVRPDTDKPVEDVLRHGGDCYDYSLLYVKLADSIGFNATQEIFPTSDDSGHAIAVISDFRTGYCILDQLAPPYCIGLRIPNSTIPLIIPNGQEVLDNNVTNTNATTSTKAFPL